MTAAHLHLALNHFPLIAIPVALVFLLHSFWSNSLQTRKFAYLILFLAALVVLPVYFSGEGAEDVVEGFAGVSEASIEAHEDFAQISMILTLLAGSLSLVAYFSKQDSPRAILFRNLVTGTAIVAVLSLAYTANLGGKVRHTELSGVSIGSEDGQPQSEKKELEQEDDE